MIRKPVVEYYIRNTTKVLVWAAAILVVLYIAAVCAAIFAPGIGSMNGIEITFGIVLAVVCMCSFKDEIHFFNQNGISRRSTFSCFVLHLLIISVALAVVEQIMGAVLGLVAANLEKLQFSTLFQALYAGRTVMTGAVGGVLINLLWSIVFYIAFGVAGYFCTHLFYKLNRLGKTLVPIGIFILFSSMPTINN